MTDQPDPPPFYERHVFLCTNDRPDGHPRGCCKSKDAVKLRDYMKARAKEAGLARLRINAAGARLLVLTHLTPPVPHWLGERVFLSQAKTVRPSGTVLAKDGMLISLPSESAGIEFSALD